MISVIVPTCFRPKLFLSMYESLLNTTQGYDIELITIIDVDPGTHALAKSTGCKINFSPERRGAIACWNIGLSMSIGEIILPAGDDQLFYPNWLDYALESHKGQLGGSGVVGMNDLAYDGNLQLATMFLFDRQYCIDNMGGVIAPPVYNYFCVDSEINAKAKSLGKFYWDKRSIIEHLHPAHGKREKDEHDILREENHFMEIDNRIFEERKAQNFPITWQGVI